MDKQDKIFNNMKSEYQPSTNPTVQTVDEDDEIDLIAIAKTIWGGRKTIIISLVVSSILGVVVAISTPEVYIASTIMVPQTGSKSQSGLSGLASLAGIDLGMMESAELSPIIYPKIVNSIPFKLELMNTKVNFSEFEEPVTLYDYFTREQKPSALGAIKKYTIGLPFVIIGAIRKTPQELLVLPKSSAKLNKPISLTREQYRVKRALDARINLSVEKKDGYMTLVVKMPEALAAAQVAQKAQELLQRDITNFKIEKSQANLDFIQERFNVAKAEVEKYQINVAVNTDRYKDLTSNLPQVETARLQSKHTIANNVFVELAKQLEQAKIQVKKETPVFTVIEPVAIPSERSQPNRLKILGIWIFLGGIVGVGIIYWKQFIEGVKQKWNDKGLAK